MRAASGRDAARLLWDGLRFSYFPPLWRVGAASDGKYEGQNVSLVHQGSELKLSWLDTDTGKSDELQCKAR